MSGSDLHATSRTQKRSARQLLAGLESAQHAHASHPGIWRAVRGASQPLRPAVGRQSSALPEGSGSTMQSKTSKTAGVNRAGQHAGGRAVDQEGSLGDTPKDGVEAKETKSKTKSNRDDYADRFSRNADMLGRREHEGSEIKRDKMRQGIRHTHKNIGGSWKKRAAIFKATL